MKKMTIRDRRNIMIAGGFIWGLGFLSTYFIKIPAGHTLINLGILLVWNGYLMPILQNSKNKWKPKFLLGADAVAVVLLLAGAVFALMAQYTTATTLWNAAKLLVVVVWLFTAFNEPLSWSASDPS